MKVAKALIAGGIAIALMAGFFKAPSERSLRDRVVSLTSEKGLCSGEQVKAPSGKSYILSAAHCAHLADKNGAITITLDDGRQIKRKVIAEDDYSDLLLIEGVPALEGIEVAMSVKNSEHLRSFTHGGARATYKTEGELVQEDRITIPIFEINSEEDAERCNKPKMMIVELFDIFMLKPTRLCAVSTLNSVTTVPIIPGSSGGMIVNDAGELVGVASASDRGAGGFSYLVRLIDIQAFLAGY